MSWKRLTVLALGLVVALGVQSVQATPVLDAGWTFDQIDDSFVDSEQSPYVFSLSAPAYFRITDYFVPGDTYYVYDGATFLFSTIFSGPLTSILPIGDPLGDAGWTSGDFSHGEILLGAGSYSITVQGDGVAGIPAGFYTRLDTAVPEPTSMGLFGVGSLALGYLRRRRRLNS
jgi:hypothetical protein